MPRGNTDSNRELTVESPLSYPLSHDPEGRTLVITALRCLLGRRYKDDVMLKKIYIHIKSTESPFLKVLNGMCSLRYMASKSPEKIGQNRVLV